MNTKICHYIVPLFPRNCAPDNIRAKPITSVPNQLVRKQHTETLVISFALVSHYAILLRE